MKIFYSLNGFSYYTDSDSFLADSLDLANIPELSADILIFITMDGTVEKSRGGTPPGARDGAEARVSRDAQKGGGIGAWRTRW